MSPVNNFDGCTVEAFRGSGPVQHRVARRCLQHTKSLAVRPRQSEYCGLGSNPTNWNVLNPGNAAFGDMRSSADLAGWAANPLLGSKPANHSFRRAGPPFYHFCNVRNGSRRA